MSFEDEYAAAAEEETAAPVRPGFHRSRVQVLPETRITASPEGGGTVRGGLGTEASPIGDVETVETETKDAPTAPLSQEDYDAGLARLAEAEDDAELEGTSALEDLAMSGSALGGHQAQQRTATRLRHAVRDPMAALFGASEGASMGGDDEFWGAATARPEVRAGQTGSRAGIARESRPARTYREGQQEAERASEEAEERDPVAFGVGEFGGAVGGALATAPFTPAIEGTGFLGRLAGSALTGEAYGTASGLLHSDSTIEDDPRALIHDGASSGLQGLALGGGVGLLGEGGRAGARALRETAEAAPLARVSSVAPGRTISRTDPTIAEFAGNGGVRSGRSFDEAIADQAERIERLGLVPLGGSPRRVHEASSAAYERIGDEVLGPIRSQVAEAGPVRVIRPRHGPDLPDAPPRTGELAADAPSVVDPLYEYAAELARSPDAPTRAMAPVVEHQADTMLDAWGDSVPYEAAEAQLREMGSQTQWTGRDGAIVRPPTTVQREVYRRMRAALDDLAEPRLAEGDVERFRAGRLDAQTARTARDLSAARLGRTAQMSGGPTLSDTSAATAMGMAGGGPLAMAAAPIVARGVRGVMPDLRARGLSAVRSLVESGAARRLGSWAPVLERALASGLPAFTVAHTRAMRDPEYAAAVGAAESEDPDEEAAFLDMYDSLSPQEATR